MILSVSMYRLYIYTIYLLISQACYSANSSPVSLRIGRHVLPAFFFHSMMFLFFQLKDLGISVISDFNVGLQPNSLNNYNKK